MYHPCNQNLRRTVSGCGGRFNKESTCLVPCIEFVIVQIFQKLFLFRSLFKLLILSHHQFDTLHQNINRKHSLCRRVFKSIFSLFHQYPDNPKLPREYFIFFSRHSNSCFTKTTGVIFSIQIGIEKFLVLEKFSMGEVSFCVPCNSVFTVLSFQEVLLFSLLFQTGLPQPLQARIPPS